NAGYDPDGDFKAIAVPVTTTQVLTVTPSMPAHTVKDLVALIKASPGKYSYASAGVTSPSRFTSELFRTSLGLDLVHVPFNGAGPAITSTMGGHTQIAFGSPASSLAQIREGTLRALAVAKGAAENSSANVRLRMFQVSDRASETGAPVGENAFVDNDLQR